MRSLAGMGLSPGDLSYLQTATDRVVHAAAQVSLVFLNLAPNS